MTPDCLRHANPKESTMEQQRKSTRTPAPLPPTVSIYQNPDYVEGILQQIYGQPLLTEFANERRNDRGQSHDTTKGGKGKVDLAAKFPGLYGGGITAEANYEDHLGQQDTTGISATSRAHYTQPYYLHVVRSALRQNSLIRDVAGAADAASLNPGDFVEFSTTFEPSQISALLDIVTPDLVESIVRRQLFTKKMATFEGGTPEQAQQFKFRLDGEMDTWGAIGRAATDAARADFRSTKTREFYGRVGVDEDELTLITMCDAEHFVIEDEDRILDGRFTVLAKVAGQVVEDEPILARNKVLERIRPEAVDQMVAAMNASVREQGRKVNAIAQSDGDEVPGGANDASGFVGKDPGEIFNLTLDARVKGASVRTLPIAIYL